MRACRASASTSPGTVSSAPIRMWRYRWITACLQGHRRRRSAAVTKSWSRSLGGVMPAHIVFEQVDARQPAGFSPSWLKTRACASASGSTAWCSATICRWKARASPATSSIAPRRHGRQAATWSWSAMRRRRRAICCSAGIRRPIPPRRAGCRDWSPRKPALDRTALQSDPTYLRARERMATIPHLEVKGDGCSPPPA